MNHGMFIVIIIFRQYLVTILTDCRKFISKQVEKE